MTSPRIYINAIAKNESKQSKEFLENVKEADGVYILDTGSTDDTVEILKTGGVNVVEALFDPFNFANARNMVLHYTPGDADLVIWMDMDDRLPLHWRTRVEQLLRLNPTLDSMFFNFTYDGTKVSHQQLKAFRPDRYQWKFPVHEVQIYTGSGEEFRLNTDITVSQSKVEKETATGRWLPLYNNMDKQWKQNQRMWFYQARDLMDAGMYDNAITSFNRAINCTDNYWIEQVVWSFIYKHICLIRTVPHDEMEMQEYLAKVNEPLYQALSISRSPDVYYRFAYIYHYVGKWTEAAAFAELSLNAEKPYNFLFNEYSKEDAHRICSSAYTKIEAWVLGAQHVAYAVALNPSSENLGDLQFYIDKGILKTDEVKGDPNAKTETGQESEPDLRGTVSEGGNEES